MCAPHFLSQLRPEPCIRDRRLGTPTNTPRLVTYFFSDMQRAMSRIGLTLGFYGGIAVVGWVNTLPHPGGKKKNPANPIFNRSTNSSSCPKQKTRHSKKSTSSSASRRPSWCARTLRASRRPPGTYLRCVGAGFSGRVRRASCRRGSWSGGWILRLVCLLDLGVAR